MVDDAGYTDRVVRSAPSFAPDRNAAGCRSIDVRKFVRFLGAVGPAGAHERTKVRRDFLLDIHAHAGTALIVANGRDVSGATGDRG